VTTGENFQFNLKAPKYLGRYGLQPLQHGTLCSPADRKNAYMHSTQYIRTNSNEESFYRTLLKKCY